MRGSHATACTVMLLGLIETVGMFLSPRHVEIPDLGVRETNDLAVHRLPPPPRPREADGDGAPTERATPEPRDDRETTLQPTGRTMRLWVDPGVSAGDLTAFLRRTGSTIGLIEREVGQDGVVRMRGGVPPDAVTGLPATGFVLSREVERYLTEVRDRHRVHIDLSGAEVSPALRQLVGPALRMRPTATALLTLGPGLSADVWGEVEAAGHHAGSSLWLQRGVGGVSWEVRATK